jgi:hypothetical protein
MEVMMDVGGSKNADLLDLKLETAYLIFNCQRFEYEGSTCVHRLRPITHHNISTQDTGAPLPILR